METTAGPSQHAQDTNVVYSLGGEASPEEYAAALASVTTAGRQPVPAEVHCDPGHLCFAEVLEANECEAAAIVTGPERDARGAVALYLVRANFEQPLCRRVRRGT